MPRAAYSDQIQYKEETEKSLSLQKKGVLWISTFGGDISVQGSASDRFRVVLTKKVQARSEAEAKAYFEQVSLKVDEEKNQLFVYPQRASGKGLTEKIKFRKDAAVLRADLTVFAPAYLQIKVSTAQGDISLKNWTRDAALRSTQGKITVQNVKGTKLDLVGKTGNIVVQDSVADSIRVTLDRGDVELKNVQGVRISAEVISQGSIQAYQVSGEQSYRGVDGPVFTTSTQGDLRIDTRGGAIQAKSVRGAFDIHSRSGKVLVEQEAAGWFSRFAENAVESLDGAVEVQLNQEFMGCMDAWSVRGTVQFFFPYRPWNEPERMGPDAPSLVRGCFGEGQGRLHVRSQQGGIQIRRAKL